MLTGRPIAAPRQHRHDDASVLTRSRLSPHAVTPPPLLSSLLAQLLQLRFFLLCKFVVVNLWCMCCACAAAYFTTE
uniref:Uncharacterized protein n=1 Tax=Fagus sylvatica TaxID=28930 RepID=A0A2N9F084_FAGSY